jgi:hypothetical protein
MKLSEALKVEDGEVKSKFDVKKIFEPIFCCQHEEPTVEDLQAALEHQCEIHGAHLTGEQRLPASEVQGALDDLLGILAALYRAKRKKDERGNCLNCAGYGPLKNGVCVNCR